MSRQSSSQTGGEGGNDCPDDTAEILTEGLEEGDGDGARGDGDGDDVMEVGDEAEEAGEPENVLCELCIIAECENNHPVCRACRRDVDKAEYNLKNDPEAGGNQAVKEVRALAQSLAAQRSQPTAQTLGGLLALQ